MPRLPVSCFIISKNEADRIARTILSVRDMVDEVIVVDSGSTDDTVKTATELGARVVFNAWPGFGQQKRFAESLCRNNWLLNLDADEVVTPQLQSEIEALFAGEAPSVAGFWIDDLVVYPGNTKPRVFARDHRFIRLYDQNKIRFKDSTLFDNVDPEDHTIASLKAPLHHFPVRSFDDLIAKCDERASYNAANAKAKSRRSLTLRIWTEFPMQFLKYYFWRTHVFGGMAGFQFAMITAFYRFIRIVRMREGSSAKALELNSSRKRPGI
jgi:glycosyltransferase involved in cell wall biosynthesis